MAQMETTLEYRYQMVDNIAEVSKESKAAQEDLKTAVKDTTAEMNTQTLSFIENVVALSALSTGITAISSAFQILGVVNDKQIERMNKMVAVTRIFTGTAQLILGLVGVIKILRNAEIALAAVETYRKVLNNPAAMALVLAGVGAAGAISGYLVGRGGGGGGGKVDQTVNIYAESTAADQRHASRDALEGIGGY